MDRGGLACCDSWGHKESDTTERLNLTELNHYDVITQLQTEILECKVNWALRSITVNKASGSDGIPAKQFQILKDDAAKVVHSICQKI